MSVLHFPLFKGCVSDIGYLGVLALCCHTSSMRHSGSKDCLQTAPSDLWHFGGELVGANAGLEELVLSHGIGIDLPFFHGSFAFVRNENCRKTGICESSYTNTINSKRTLKLTPRGKEEQVKMAGRTTYPASEAAPGSIPCSPHRTRSGRRRPGARCGHLSASAIG